MRSLQLVALLALTAAGCGGEDGTPVAPTNGSGPRDVSEAPEPAAGEWDLASSDEGAGLFLSTSDHRRVVTLFCPAESGELLVNVPGFRPVGSEERMSFGSGSAVTTLVADARGDRLRGGVSASGPLPPELAAILGGRLAINYGAQNLGPLTAPPRALADQYVAACRGRTVTTPPPSAVAAHPCEMQDGERLSVRPLRAVGTEPFWAARIQGRCVTYSHPEDQQGTRVWTRYSPASGGGTWTGAFGGQRFELAVRARPGCSDGMSDKSYPMSVELLVGGERRRGCAEPL